MLYSEKHWLPGGKIAQMPWNIAWSLYSHKNFEFMWSALLSGTISNHKYQEEQPALERTNDRSQPISFKHKPWATESETQRASSHLVWCLELLLNIKCLY